MKKKSEVGMPKSEVQNEVKAERIKAKVCLWISKILPKSTIRIQH